MLTIRQEQMALFGSQHERDFAAALSQRLAAAHQQALNPTRGDEVASLVELGFARARDLGLRSEGSVAVLVELMLRFGPRFERSPHGAWAEDLLARRAVPDSLRLRLIRERLDQQALGRSVVEGAAPGPDS